MKGLLLKDFYMITKYCRSYLIIMALFALQSIFFPETSSAFWIVLCLIAGMLPMNTTAYDEKSKWIEYCGVLPYSKEQIVSSKYVLGLLGEAAVLLLSLILKLTVTGADDILLYSVSFGAGFIIGCISTAIVVPFIFALGVEKARIAYIVILAAIGAAAFINTDGMSAAEADPLVISPDLLIILLAAAVAVYAFSWYLSIVIYKKREI